MEMVIAHPSHPHKLTQERSQMPYLCSGCKEVGIGSSYKCKTNGCNFYLHQECAISPFSVSHPLSKSCKFTFLREGRRKKHLCEACGRKVKGFRYKCSCSFIKRYLHPQCSIYQEEYELNGWTLKLKKKITKKCLHCEQKGGVKGWGYVSSCGHYCFHVVCLWGRLYDDWSKGLFTGLSFDVSEMVSTTMVKLLLNQVQFQGSKKISNGGKVAEVFGIGSSVTSIVGSVFNQS